MSAFLCSPAHIGQLAAFIRRDPHSRFQPDELAGTFAGANLLSVGHRYGLTQDEVARENGYTSAEAFTEACMAESMGPCVLTPVMALKMIACLDYQSCEVEGWRESIANWRLQEVQSVAVNGLPGYQSAPWAYEAPVAEGTT